MVRSSEHVVTAWEDSLMVGFARCTTDHVFNGHINNVVVDSGYRNRGIGTQLVTRIITANPKVTYMLRTDAHNEDFYRKMGFKTAEHALIFERTL